MEAGWPNNGRKVFGSVKKSKIELAFSGGRRLIAFRS
jgi:hypothetical protein